MKHLLARAGEAENFRALETQLVDVQSRARGVFEKLFPSDSNCHHRESGDPDA
jgi:hypothetical protein